MNKKIKILERALKTAERKAGSEQQKLAALHKKALAKQDCTAERAKKALTKKLEVAEANNVATNAAMQAQLEECKATQGTPCCHKVLVLHARPSLC